MFSYPSGVYVTEDDIFVSDANNTRFHVARLGRNGVFKASYVCMQMKVLNFVFFRDVFCLKIYFLLHCFYRYHIAMDLK